MSPVVPALNAHKVCLAFPASRNVKVITVQLCLLNKNPLRHYVYAKEETFKPYIHVHRNICVVFSPLSAAHLHPMWNWFCFYYLCGKMCIVLGLLFKQRPLEKQWMSLVRHTQEKVSQFGFLLNFVSHRCITPCVMPCLLVASNAQQLCVRHLKHT